MWQAEHVQSLLNDMGHRVALLGMTTQGDQILDRALSQVGGKGLFVKELEVALEEKRADLAVHSLKDVPMELPEGFSLACVMEREDPRDAFVSNTYANLDALPQGAVVGTSSLRRVALLRSQRPDLRIEPLRGNLDTRLRKLDDGMEVCSDRADVVAALAPLVHRTTWLAVAAERAVSRAMGGSCSMPLAAYATLADDTLTIDAAWGDTEGLLPLVRVCLSGPVSDLASATDLGQRAADDLRAKVLAQGGTLAHLAGSASQPV